MKVVWVVFKPLILFSEYYKKVHKCSPNNNHWPWKENWTLTYHSVIVWNKSSYLHEWGELDKQTILRVSCLAGEIGFLQCCSHVFFLHPPAEIVTGSVCTLVKQTVRFHMEVIYVAVKLPLTSTTTAAMWHLGKAVGAQLYDVTSRNGGILQDQSWGKQLMVHGLFSISCSSIWEETSRV